MRYLIALSFYLINSVVYALPLETPKVITHTELTRVVTGLVCVVFIIILLSWILKRLNVVNLGSSKGFQFIASMTLGSKEKMVLFKVGGQYLLLGVGSGAVNVLYDFGEQLPEGFDSDSKPSFAELLKSVVRKS